MLAAYANGMASGWYAPLTNRQSTDEFWTLLPQTAGRGLRHDRQRRGPGAALGGGLAGGGAGGGRGILRWRDVEFVVAAMVWLGALVAAIGIAQFFTGIDVVRYIPIPGLSLNTDLGGVFDRSVLNRVSSTAVHPIEFGVAMACLLPLALHRTIHLWGAKGRWCRPCLIFVGAFLSVSRSAILALAVGRHRALPRLAGPVAAARVVARTVAVVGIRLAIPGLVGTLLALFTNLGNDPSVSGRTSDYAVVFDVFEDHPWLGRGLFTFLPRSYRILDNQWLGILSTWAPRAAVVRPLLLTALLPRPLGVPERGTAQVPAPGPGPLGDHRRRGDQHDHLRRLGLPAALGTELPGHRARGSGLAHHGDRTQGRDHRGRGPGAGRGACLRGAGAVQTGPARPPAAGAPGRVGAGWREPTRPGGRGRAHGSCTSPEGHVYPILNALCGAPCSTLPHMGDDEPRTSASPLASIAFRSLGGPEVRPPRRPRRVAVPREVSPCPPVRPAPRPDTRPAVRPCECLHGPRRSPHLRRGDRCSDLPRARCLELDRRPTREARERLGPAEEGRAARTWVRLEAILASLGFDPWGNPTGSPSPSPSSSPSTSPSSARRHPDERPQLEHVDSPTHSSSSSPTHSPRPARPRRPSPTSSSSPTSPTSSPTSPTSSPTSTPTSTPDVDADLDATAAGGWFPDPRFGRVPDGWAPVRTVNGSYTVSTPGAVVEDLRINGDLVINAANVTVRRVEVVGGTIDNFRGPTCRNGLTIKDSTVRAAGGTNDNGEPAFGAGGYTADNVLIDGMAEGFRVGGKSAGCGAVVIANSYAYITSPTTCVDWHGDSLQGYDGPALTIRNSVLVLDERSGCGGTAPFFYPDTQGNTSADIAGLIVDGGGYPFRLGTAGKVQGLNIVNNSWYYGPVDVKCRLLSRLERTDRDPRRRRPAGGGAQPDC